MICVRLDGGLGNQLFQYAAGRALALRHNTELSFDTSALNTVVSGVTPRNLELHCLKHASLHSSASNCHVLKWLRYMPSLSYWISPWRIYTEKSLGFNAEFDNLKDMTYLYGYWQSYRYFSHISDQLVSDFTPVSNLSDASRTIEEKIESSISVAIHVRRGDYVSLKTAADMHGVLPISYYEKAIDTITNAVANVRYFVFSDDPKWCRDNLPLDPSAIFVTHNTGENSWQDMMLMAHCQHHIIANSSFSWWGAWLADHRYTAAPTRMVIAPARWFAGQPHQDLSDRFPEHWIVQ